MLRKKDRKLRANDFDKNHCYFQILTEKNTTANSSNALHHRHVVGFEIFVALAGPIAAVHVVQVTAGSFITVAQVDVF